MTVLANFAISTEFCGPREVRVVVYDSLKGLRMAATRYDNVTRSKKRKLRDAHSDSCGICHRFENFDRDGNRYPLCAIVRLAEPYLGIGIVSHELAHAAIHIHDIAAQEELTGENDEQFCWVLGDLVRQTVNELIAAGIYD